jgi:hypothetical protein
MLKVLYGPVESYLECRNHTVGYVKRTAIARLAIEPEYTCYAAILELPAQRV